MARAATLMKRRLSSPWPTVLSISRGYASVSSAVGCGVWFACARRRYPVAMA